MRIEDVVDSFDAGTVIGGKAAGGKPELKEPVPVCVEVVVFDPGMVYGVKTACENLLINRRGNLQRGINRDAHIETSFVNWSDGHVIPVY